MKRVLRQFLFCVSNSVDRSACKNGQCECACDPTIMQSIEGIELKDVEGGSTITITGKVDAATLAPMMQECLLGEKK